MASTGKKISAKSGSATPPASGEEVRKIVGRISDDRLAAVLATGATAAQVTEAFTWLTSDDYIAARHQPPLTGVVSEVYELLKPEIAEVDEERPPSS
ncbi:MAG TPA: hypothetical protein VLV76_07285 [Candidatus Acidoferrum sp.]|nr:hypothetical protein [Candidatus Acidoferrum sp.]